ncbi:MULTISPECIES: hypothetical protein [unclassified Bradyrhizobium]|uniref:hypothetical protein n=1 Tax=unclassified Bradyrhizobium TaxID=2631580 RepID=UPI0028ED0A0A|nr:MULTISPECIES: hypothetical protein [unclassified Bradyrhizobium]
MRQQDARKCASDLPDGTSCLLLRPINATGKDVASISEKTDFQQRTNGDRRRTRTPDILSGAARRSRRLSSVIATSEATTRSRAVETTLNRVAALAMTYGGLSLDHDRYDARSERNRVNSPSRRLHAE